MRPPRSEYHPAAVTVRSSGQEGELNGLPHVVDYSLGGRLRGVDPGRLAWTGGLGEGVRYGHIALLQKLCRHRTASVSAGVTPRSFMLSRGVAQGHPISALFLIAVMEVCCRKLNRRWQGFNRRGQGRNYGVVVETPGRYLRLAA
eukprot:174413-Pyramimonas_sp.AAC.1